MALNVRAKGQSGEREVADMLNLLCYGVGKVMGAPADVLGHYMMTFQRNQNQSAVGGSDLSNNLGLSIEVKRQETLCVPMWWRQCVEAADRNNDIPILIYRQNRKAWHVVMHMQLPIERGPKLQQMQAVATTDLETFKGWMRLYVRACILDGWSPKY